MRFLLLIVVASLSLCSAATAEVRTSGNLEPAKPFTLMVIRPENSPPSVIDQWLTQPQTPEMAKWLQLSTVREYSPGDDWMREHHQFILSSMRSVPAIALVDGAGGCLCVLSGQSFPRSELGLARSLESYYAAVMQAAREAAARGPGFQTMTPAELQMAQLRQAQQGGYQADDPGPDLYASNQTWRGGLLNPSIDANINSGVDQGTRRDVLTGILLLAFAAIICTYLYTRAITDEPERRPRA